MAISSTSRVFAAMALAAVVFAAAPRAAQADAAGDAYATAQKSFQQLKSSPEDKRRFRHNWQETIDKFKVVEQKYPKSWVADDALFTIGKLYYELYDVSRLRADLDKAVEAFRACEKRFPKSNYADDSLFWSAKALHVLNRHEQEVAALDALIEKYPKGDMVPDARRLLAKLEADGEVRRPVAAKATPAPTATPVSVSAVSPTPMSTPEAAQPGPRVRTGGERSAESQQVTQIRHWSNEGYTRIAIYLGGSVRWTINELKADGDLPPRIYLDLERAHVGKSLMETAARMDNNYEIPIGDGLLQRARVAQYDAETVRVVLDVAAMETWNVVQFDDPFRILVDVNAPEAGSAAAAVASSGGTTSPGRKGAATETAEARALRLAKAREKSSLSFYEQLGLKVGKIYVDAGHGGHDPGAIGPGGVREKDVTLAIAKKLKARLVELGYNAVLTREDDTFLQLEERSAIANEGKGDLFVSVHCNSHDPAYKKSAPSGVETYFANVASDKASERLAAMENATTTQKMSELQLILEGLLRGEFTVTSADLAASVQSALFKAARKANPATRDHGVRSALFYVLLTSRMPAILVETAYISNAKDEKRLKDAKYQQSVADAVAEGIDAFLRARAIHDLPNGKAPEQTASGGAASGAQ